MRRNKSGTSRTFSIHPDVVLRVLGQIDGQEVLNKARLLKSLIKEIRRMGKVVGELKEKKAGVGYTDVTVGTQKVRAWDTIKTRDGKIILNPVKEQLDGCRVGDTVEADIVSRDSGGRTYLNLAGIAIQSAPGAQADAPGEVVYPDRTRNEGQAASPLHNIDRFYLAMAPAVYRGVMGMFAATDFAWIEENHERISAVCNRVIEHAFDHMEGLKSTLENKE
jgi:hypothetical protein